MVCGRVCSADGGIDALRASCISVVYALAAAISAFGRDDADPHLDIEYCSYLLCLAFAHAWTAVGGS